jgi:hypothetical protein
MFVTYNFGKIAIRRRRHYAQFGAVLPIGQMD